MRSHSLRRHGSRLRCVVDASSTARLRYVAYPRIDGGRESRMTEFHWRFRGPNPDGGRDFGNANVWAFDPTLDVFTREVCQNILDVRVGPTVHVSFRLYRLGGPDLVA